MGHPPLIADNTHTTRLPADVEEDKFTPSCMSLPTPEGTHGDSSSVYFGLKLRLARLVKNVKKQTFRDPIGAAEDAAELSIEHASAFEGEINAFLAELPPSFKLDVTQDIAKPIPPLPPSGSPSPVRIAQKCELAILANRLIVKLYLPFLKEAAALQRLSHQAVFGTISAAHNVVYAARVLHGHRVAGGHQRAHRGVQTHLLALGDPGGGGRLRRPGVALGDLVVLVQVVGARAAGETEDERHRESEDRRRYRGESTGAVGHGGPFVAGRARIVPPVAWPPVPGTPGDRPS